MLKLQTAWMMLVLAGALYGQSAGKGMMARRFGNDQDEAAIRLLLAEGFETSWNHHQPAAAVAPDKCIDDAVFINTTGGWIKGRENFLELITRLHGPGGPFHEETRRHAVEELRFIRPDVAFAVVRTFDKRRAGVAITGEETRGLIILSKEGGHWKVNATENTRIQATPVGRP